MATERRGRRGGVKLPRLREIRLERGYTVRGLAKDSGINPATVTAIENDRRGAQGTTMLALAKTLGVEPPELVGGGVAEREEARPADPLERAMAYAARGVAEREGRDPREVFRMMRSGPLTVEEILGGESASHAPRGGEDAFERARKASASHAGLADADREGERVGAGASGSEEVSAQRAGHLSA